MHPAGPTLVSGEGVRLDLATAGVGSRTVAAAIDAAIQLAALLVLVLIDAAVAPHADTAAVAAVLIVEGVLVLAGYPIVMEWTTKGRTVGKISLGLRVVRDDGGPIGLRHAVVRGLASLVLEKPGLLAPLTTAAGAFTASASVREKRIGDMLAGTVVLNERAAAAGAPLPPPWVPYPLQAWALGLDLQALDDALALRLRRFVTRAYAMTPGAQHQLGEQLLADVLAVTSPPPPPGTPTAVVLMSVLAERRRRATVPPAYPPAGAPAATPRPRPSRGPDEPPELPFAPPR